MKEETFYKWITIPRPPKSIWNTALIALTYATFIPMFVEYVIQSLFPTDELHLMYSLYAEWLGKQLDMPDVIPCIWVPAVVSFIVVFNVVYYKRPSAVVVVILTAVINWGTLALLLVLL